MPTDLSYAHYLHNEIGRAAEEKGLVARLTDRPGACWWEFRNQDGRLVGIYWTRKRVAWVAGIGLTGVEGWRTALRLAADAGGGGSRVD